MSKLKLLTKISTSSVCGKITNVVEPRVIMEVSGIAVSVRTGEDKHRAGELFHCFKGQFQAVDAATGEIYRAGECFLPKVAENILLPVVQQSGTNGGIEFGFKISVKPSDKPIGYEFTAEPLLMVENDPLQSLLLKIEDQKVLLLEQNNGVASIPPKKNK